MTSLLLLSRLAPRSSRARLVGALLLLAACSQRVELGGPATVVRVDAEAPGQACPAGGVAIHTGLDADEDLYLDDGEITSTQYACSGVGPVACAGGNVHVGDVTVSAAADAATLAGVHCVEGDLLITGVADELPALPDLERVTGDVILAANPGLTSLAPIGALDAVGGVVLVQGNDALVDLGGLGRLAQAQAISVVGNRALEDLRGLDELVEFPGSLRVANNPGLASLDGLEQLRACDGTIEIRGNRSLAVASLPTLDNVVLLEVTGNDALTSLTLPALRRVAVRLMAVDNAVLDEVLVPQLSSVGDYVRVENAPALATLELPSLRSAGSVIAVGDPQLARLSAPALAYLTARVDLRGLTSLTALELEALVSVGGDVTLVGLEQLGDLTGLASLASIGGNLALENSAGPASMAGLERLTLVAGGLTIQNNPELASLGDLDSLEAIGGDLRVVGNVNLGNAAAQAFADGVDVGGDVTIAGND